MTPISTKISGIDEVIILRRAGRIAPEIRRGFSIAKQRQSKAAWYERFLDEHPLRREGFERFMHHLNECFAATEHEVEETVLDRGFF